MSKEISDILRTHDFEFFGKSKHKLTPQGILEMDNILLLDVRSNEEVSALSVTFKVFKNVSFLHIPIDEIPDRYEEIPKDLTVAIFCPSNFRSALVYAFLMEKGYQSVRILDGGYAAVAEIVMPGKLYKQLHS